MRTTVLTTDRLRLTTWEPADVLELAELHSDPAVMVYLGDGRPETLPQAQARLDGYLRDQDERGWTKWRVEDDDGVMIGRAGYGLFDGGRELGYTLARSRWGHGLATELARALVDWDRAHPLAPRQPLYAFAVHENTASRRVLEKLGFVFVGHREHGGRLHDFYALRG